MSAKKEEIVNQIKDSLGQKPKFFSSRNSLDVYFNELYDVVENLEITYSSQKIDKYYVDENIVAVVESIINVVVAEEEKNKDSTTFMLSLNDMKLIDRFTKFISLQLIYRFLPNNIKPQKYLLNDSKEAIYGVFNTIPRENNNELLEYTLIKLIHLFTKSDTNPKISQSFHKCVKLTNFYYDLIIGSLYMIAESVKPNEFENCLSILEDNISDTYELYANYSIWISHLNNNSKIQTLLSKQLSNLVVLKQDGLKSLIQFILQSKESEEIDLSKIAHLNELILKKPSSCKTNKQYFHILFNQIFDLLELEESSVVIVGLMNILSTLYNKNIKIINDFFFSRLHSGYIYYKSEKEKETVISSSKLIKKMNVFITLTRQNDNNFIQSLLEYRNEYDFMFLLYRYANYIFFNSKKNKLDQTVFNDEYINSLITTLKFYLLCSNGKWYLLNYLIVNYDVESQSEVFGKLQISSQSKLPQLSFMSEISSSISKNDDVSSKIQSLQHYIKTQDVQNELMMRLLESVSKSTDIINNVFVTILKRWCESYDAKDEDPDVFLQLNDLKIMNSMVDSNNFKDAIISDPQNILLLVVDLLELPSYFHSLKVVEEDDSDLDDEDENVETNQNVFNMLLKLISYIISVSLTSKIVQLLEENNGKTPEIEENIENADRKLLKQALDNINDPLPPIKAQGLYEIRELLLRGSNIVDYGVVLELHLNEMKNEEPFVYLNSIKGLVILCSHEKSLQYLMRLYDEYGQQDSVLNISFEEELRLGEVLSQAFQSKKYLMNKDEPLHGMFNIVINKINAHNAKKVDNRVRMSAMSILGILLQVNMDLLTESELIDCFSCIKGILTFEFDENDDSFKILRRASIYLLNDMIYNSGLDRFVISFEEYESLVALLRYNRDVKETDDVAVDMIDKILSIINDIWKETFTFKEDTTDDLLNTLKIR
ncbi:unnamed protein product [Hanseniaspora opuntiae]